LFLHLVFLFAGDVRDLVAVYKNPPYPIFYDVVYHSYALVPMLASPLYYASKFSSTVLTSFITGAPVNRTAGVVVKALVDGSLLQRSCAVSILLSCLCSASSAECSC
jgi:hypothetical protein